MTAPVAYRVKDFGDGWILCHTLEQAEREAKGCGNLIEPLVRQDGATAVTTFTLDTSGEVLAQRASSGGPFAFHWTDLDAFTQGYVEASAEAWPAMTALDGVLEVVRHRPPALSDLASETVSKILKDCGAYLITLRPELHSADSGRRFWAERQRGFTGDADGVLNWLNFPKAFPPLTVTLGGDGKVRLSTIERAEAGR